MKTFLAFASLALLVIGAVVFDNWQSQPPVQPRPAAFQAETETVVYAFTAFYCPFCWVAEPGIKSLEDITTVQRVNANGDRELAKKYSITGVPTLVVVVDGKEVFRAEGADSPAEVREFLSR